MPFLPSKKILSYEEQDNQEKNNLLELDKAKPLAAPIFLPLDTYIVNLELKRNCTSRSPGRWIHVHGEIRNAK